MPSRAVKFERVKTADRVGRVRAIPMEAKLSNHPTKAMKDAMAIARGKKKHAS